LDRKTPSRRQFLSAVANLASASWVAMNWPQIALAAEQAQHGAHHAHGSDDTPHSRITTLTPAEAAEVDAMVGLIVPGGATPGAREVRSLYFIDNALGSFFAAQLPAFREGLGEFTSGFAARHGSAGPFSAAPEARQVAWLTEVEKTPFFLAVRRLTLLGLTALPTYGGNHEYKGWALIGMENQHMWEPPFGHYDQDYPGFQPYPGTKPLTA
jgi:hypothetical protein